MVTPVADEILILHRRSLFATAVEAWEQRDWARAATMLRSISRLLEKEAAGLGPGQARDLRLQAAQAFAEFWFEEGYERWLAVNPERKVPLRLGTADAPRRFIDAWCAQPLADSDLSLTYICGAETVARLRDGIAAAPRWGIRECQGALLNRMHEEIPFSIVFQV